MCQIPQTTIHASPWERHGLSLVVFWKTNNQIIIKLYNWPLNLGIFPFTTCSNQWFSGKKTYSIANTLVLRLSCTNRSKWFHWFGPIFHDDVIKGKHFPRYWTFVRGIHRSPVNSPRKGHWRVALMLSFICAWINCWVNNREAGDLRHHRSHYDVVVMLVGVCQHWFR